MASKVSVFANWQLSDIFSFEQKAFYVHSFEKKQVKACRREWLVTFFKEGDILCLKLQIYKISKPIFVRIHFYQQLAKSDENATKVCYSGKEESYLFQQKDMATSFRFKRLASSVDYIKCYIYFYESQESPFIVNLNSTIKPHNQAIEVAKDLQPSTEMLSGDLSLLLQKELFADVTLRCGSQSFKVHKNILCARSDVFAAMFQSPMKEAAENVVDIKEVKPEVFRAVLEYIYSGRTKDMVDWNTACEILDAADFYSLPGLKKTCSAYLKSALSEDNALSILAVADLYEEDLKQEILHFACDRYDVLKMSENWKRLQNEKPLLVIAIMNEKIEYLKSLFSDTKI